MAARLRIAALWLAVAVIGAPVLTLLNNIIAGLVAWHMGEIQ